MALAGAAAPDRQPSPSNLTFGSNNPFRNRVGGTSPSPRNEHAGSQQFPFPGPSMASTNTSKNPFLDPEPNGRAVNGGSKKPSDDLDVFKELSLLDKPATNGAPPPRMAPRAPQNGAQHRPGGSDDRRRPPPPYASRPGDSPPKRPATHQRRASESSMMDERERRDRRERTDRGDRPPRTESEERRRRERRREREERHRREKERVRNGGSKSSNVPGKKPRNLDIIDKLDVTGIYGQGLFHHDGPFDACNPHRNAKKDRRAPMQAFPEGSANMALGGAGPLNSRIDLDKFHGRGEEGFQDYAVTRKADTTYINPTDRIEQVHGPESYGLGTSTFLDGAPASRSALQRRESEDAYTASAGGEGGGLTRKKSLAQRLRGMSNQNRTRPSDLRSPDGGARCNGGGNGLTLVDTSSPPAERYGPGRSQQSQSAGGPRRAAGATTRDNEVNPFDEYDQAFERKGQQIQFAEQERPSRGRAPSDAKAPMLTRSVTADSAVNGSGGDGEGGGSGRSGGGGLLNRMRSLKGGRRGRPEGRKEGGA